MLVPDLGGPVDIGGQTVTVAAESGLQAADLRVQNLHSQRVIFRDPDPPWLTLRIRTDFLN